MGTNIDLNTDSFAFLGSSLFKTTEWCKARITAFALPDRTSNSSSCLISLENAKPRYLNFFTCFNDTPPTCSEWKDFLERCSTSVLKVLIFIPAMSHASAKPFSTSWKPDSEEDSKTKSSAKSSRIILHLPIGSADLVHPVHINYEKER